MPRWVGVSMTIWSTAPSTLSSAGDRLALAALSAYRRLASPYKGFRCAYGVVHRRGSCSDVALRITRRFGAVRMLRLMPCRFPLMLWTAPAPGIEVP